MNKKAFIAAVFSLAILSSVSAEPIRVYFGTYTRGQNSSKGIYRSILDSKTGKQRRLDIQKALDVLDYKQTLFPQTEKLVIEKNGNKIITFVACQYFCGQELYLHNNYYQKTDGTSCVIYTVLEGVGNIHWEVNTRPESISIVKGETVIIPAFLSNYTIEPLSNPLRILKFFVLRAFVSSW